MKKKVVKPVKKAIKKVKAFAFTVSPAIKATIAIGIQASKQFGRITKVEKMVVCRSFLAFQKAAKAFKGHQKATLHAYVSLWVPGIPTGAETKGNVKGYNDHPAYDAVKRIVREGRTGKQKKNTPVSFVGTAGITVLYSKTVQENAKAKARELTEKILDMNELAWQAVAHDTATLNAWIFEVLEYSREDVRSDLVSVKVSDARLDNMGFPKPEVTVTPTAPARRAVPKPRKVKAVTKTRAVKKTSTQVEKAA